MSAQPCQPADPNTRHRLHWVKGNGYEVWEWVGASCWWRLGASVRSFTAERAGREGWRYIGEAHPPAEGIALNVESRETLYEQRTKIEDQLEALDAELMSRGWTP